MDWERYLKHEEHVKLCGLDRCIAEARSERTKLRRRANKRMERAAEKARKEANDHQQ